MTEFITVATFNFAHEITILKTILDHEEIPYLFQNENLISIDPLAASKRMKAPMPSASPVSRLTKA